MLDKGFSIFIKVAWELYFSLQDLLIDSHGVFIIEWINTCQHFVDQNSECPPVNWLSMSFIEKNFWGKILRCSAKRVSASFDVFGETKVCELEVPISSDE
jgi:hypothetical protein